MQERITFAAMLLFASIFSVVSESNACAQLGLPQKYWRLTFSDDFRGKRGGTDDAYCYDVLKPQCYIWSGGSYNCDLSEGGTSPISPARENMIAALKTVEPNHPWANMTFAQVQALYGQVLKKNLEHLNKCRWTLYQILNSWATDYDQPVSHYSARMDGTQVKVDPSGKGYLELSATYAPIEYNCVYGGSFNGQTNCQVYAFAPGQINPTVAYWADADPLWPGVYYKAISGACPYGGSFNGQANCQLKSFPRGFLEEHEVAYWVDPDPRWPGVFYRNQTYRCKNNIYYEPLEFRNLTCPILNGAVMSIQFDNKPYVDSQGQETKRGATQKWGRFEAKVRLPKAQWAFPAAWLLPESGGWPYDGGEIDLMESRVGSDLVVPAFQTYHHGKCYDDKVLPPKPPQRIPATDSKDCTAKQGLSMTISRGTITMARTTDEFARRDHVFAVEWSAQRIDYFINNVLVNSVVPGAPATAVYPPGSPPKLAFFDVDNFPTRAFYWILNHSTWVPPGEQATFTKQTYKIDYVHSYQLCEVMADFCPSGGVFIEGVGCQKVNGNVYPSACQNLRQDCPNGGTVAGPNCQVHAFQNPEVILGLTYWVDADPRWPGVYYKADGLACPLGGSLSSGNCRLLAIQNPKLIVGVHYWVDTDPRWPGVYYSPDPQGGCLHGGGQGVNCRVASFKVPPVYVRNGVDYWVDADPRWPGVYYKAVDGACPWGGSFNAVNNCQLQALPADLLEQGVDYWVDKDARWPGVYYAPDFRN
jgi:beta-glucanase (GH16 family)